MTKRHCYVTDVCDAIEKLADALDPQRAKPFSGDILDLLEWAARDVLELRQQLSERDKQVTLLRDEVIRCRDWFEAQAEVTSKGGPSSWELMLLRDERDTANEALAITRPKP